MCNTIIVSNLFYKEVKSKLFEIHYFISPSPGIAFRCQNLTSKVDNTAFLITVDSTTAYT